MDIQISCSDPPPCDTQPSGKINKAAFKLFGKRRSGSGVQSIFSIRNKGDATDKELVRSKTHHGLTTTDELSELEGRRKEESVSSDRLNSAAAAPACSAITKSFSFFSLLRRNNSRVGDRTTTLGQRGRGLKGLFNSIRWRRKPPSHDDPIEIQDILKETKGVDLILSCSSKNVDVENATLTLEPPIQILQDNAVTWEKPSLQDSNEEHVTSSCVMVQPVAEESPAPSPSPVTVQTQEPLTAKHSSPSHLASMTPPQDYSSVDPPSEDRLNSMFNDVTSLKSFDSLTGCGDIIADPEEDSGNGGSVASSGTGSSNGVLQVSADRCSPAKPPLPPQVTGLISMSVYTPSRHRICPPTKTPQGSGIVAYMGGGEEMASPEGVDDADMQGLWHMLPQKGEDSPALPHLPTRQDKRLPQLKSLGLSKIPVGGSSRVGKQQQQQLTRPSPPPIVKDIQDVPPSDEGYWDSPTPGPEDEDSGFLQRDGLPRDSCSGDALYDLYDLDSPGTVGSDDDDTISPTPSTGDLKMTPPSKKPSCSSFRSIKGSTSLPRESKIPISVRQKPPSHSSSQGALSSPVSPTSHSPTDTSSKTNTPPRTRIPVSKVPVRSSGNKNAKVAQNRK
ncbi:APC membrane recruitment protein 2 [Tachysurus fulvidraco]|uniref:APC membrane recruitment protein 2 n=1 Tax=Tachysurus fulvidraco TaxID=1234273 RepID=UPI001FEE314B|nr:APC membrane recruitment protein 2 [Tachysurus fulvidraco]